MTRAACLFPVLVTAGLALTPMARAQTDSTASEIAALRRELGTLAARNQQQIDALQNQVRELSAELAKSRRGRAAGGRPVEPKPGAEAADKETVESHDPQPAGSHQVRSVASANWSRADLRCRGETRTRGPGGAGCAASLRSELAVAAGPPEHRFRGLPR